MDDTASTPTAPTDAMNKAMLDVQQKLPFRTAPTFDDVRLMVLAAIVAACQQPLPPATAQVASAEAAGPTPADDSNSST